MRFDLRLILVAATFAAVAACDKNRGNRGQCEQDADCDPYYCYQGACVECFRNQQCDQHRECTQSACELLGADDPSQTYNAHGNWRGTPGQPGYEPTSTCASSNECGFGQVCNPFTAGCIPAADFNAPCGPNNSCSDTGPNGEVLACEPQSNKCLPAPLCVDDHNCGGLTDFVCDQAIRVCQFLQRDCTPPAEVQSECPLLPKEFDECLPGLFCSPLGKCVQCTCDLDCPTDGGLPRCYVPTGRCVPEDFCTLPGECEVGFSCDRRYQVCKPFCDDNEDCTGADEICDTDDNVCRPIGDLPCEPDTFEPNNSRVDAETNGSTLPIPARDAELTVPEAGNEFLTLCDEDLEDWYLLPLVRGDLLTIRGTSLDGMSADMTAYGPDGTTQLDTGRISSYSSDAVSFTANYAANYLLRVDVDSYSSGSTYSLTVSNATGAVCDDTFELAAGINDTPAAATPLNPVAGVPDGCTLTGTIGATHTVSCTGTTFTLCQGDVDYYLINTPLGSDISVALSNFAGDLELYLYGPFYSGETPDTSRVADSSATSSSPETATFAARPPATYLAKVYRYSGTFTNYDLVTTVTTGPVCAEDAYDADPSNPATGAPLPALVSDPDGLNDVFAQASFIDVAAGSPVLVKSTNAAGAGLNLCRGDEDWFRLGRNEGGTLVDLTVGNRVQLELTDVTVSGTDTIEVAGGTAEDEMFYDPTNARRFVVTTDGGPTYALVTSSAMNASPVPYTLSVTYIPPPACNEDGLGDTAASRNDSLSPTDRALALLPGGTPDWPDAIDEAATATGLTLCGQDVDWYKIAVPAGARMLATVRYDYQEAEVGLALYDATVLTATNLDQPLVPPDTGELDASVLDGRGWQRVRGAPTGTAYIMVYNRTGWPLLSYSLEVRFLSATCSEDVYDQGATQNDTWENATPVVLTPVPGNPQLVTGFVDLLRICSGTGELDWFDFPIAKGDQISANVYYDPDEGNLDLYLYGPGPGGVTSSFDYDWDDSARSGVLHVEYTTTASSPVGDYLLKVLPYAAGTGGVYNNLYALELMVLRACVGDAYEPSSQASPATINVGNNFTNLSLCSEEDFYVIPAGAAGARTVCATFSHAAGDIDLYVSTDVEGTSIVAGAASTTDNERAVFTASASTPYYIKVTMKPSLGNTTYGLQVLNGDVTCP